LFGGKISLVNESKTPYYKYAMKPEETRNLFKEKGWEKIVGFQTRNVAHLGHEYLQKSALTMVDGLFINPVIGKKKKGDFTDEVILDSYEVLIENYYPKDRVVLGIFRQRCATQAQGKRYFMPSSGRTTDALISS